MLLASLAGLAAGAIHVLSGPDHLSAVAPLAVHARGASWRSGLLWGTGHSAGVLAIGALALALRDVLPIDHISSWSERAVGIALVGVGLWGLRNAFRQRIHSHEHSHDGIRHVHVHLHVAGREPHDGARPPHHHSHVSFGFGVLHGLAGSAHLFGIVPALALPTRLAAGVYLASFGVGSIAAMTIFSAAVGWMAGAQGRRGAFSYRTVLSTCSTAAVVVGAIWLMS